MKTAAVFARSCALALLAATAAAAAATRDTAAAVAAAPATRSAAASAMAASAPAARAAAPIDINSANLQQLKTLPGIGDAEAARIVAGRPYLSKASLVSNHVLPAGVYQIIRHRISAVQKPGSGPRRAAAPPKPAPSSAATKG
ncbi:MAG: helix-hairpin-helix domain-containing protein [Burkholderiaceae bacterium]